MEWVDISAYHAACQLAPFAVKVTAVAYDAADAQAAEHVRAGAVAAAVWIEEGERGEPGAAERAAVEELLATVPDLGHEAVKRLRALHGAGFWWLLSVGRNGVTPDSKP